MFDNSLTGDRIIDTSTEWRTFSAGDKSGNQVDPNRIGAVQDINDSTTMSLMSVKLGASDDPSRRWARNIQSGAEKSRQMAFRNMAQILTKLNAEPFIDKAKSIYKKVEESTLLKLRSRDAIAAACVFVACREMKVTRTLKEICSVSTVPLKNVAKMSKLVMQIVGNCGLGTT